MTDVKLVSDMTVAELETVIHACLTRQGTGSRLVNLSVQDFTDLMLERLAGRAFGTAQVEASIGERVLRDWQGLQAVGAVTQPFRITSGEEAAKLGKDLSAAIQGGLRGSFVVAIAVVGPEGGYASR